MNELIELLQNLTPAENGLLNILIQAAVLEAVIVLLIPALGTAVNAVIVKGVRGVAVRLLGSRIEYFVSNYFLFVGVVIHELSHALFAFLTGAKVTEVAVFRPEGNALGHVCYYTRGPRILAALQNGLSSCAPVVTGLVVSALLTVKVFPVLTAPWQRGAVIYLLVAVVFHMNMSKADLKNYFKGAGVLVPVALPFCFLYLLRF